MQTCKPCFHISSCRRRNEGLEQMRRMQGRGRRTPAAKSGPSFEQNATPSSLPPHQISSGRAKLSIAGWETGLGPESSWSITPLVGHDGHLVGWRALRTWGSCWRSKCFSAGDKPNQAALNDPKGGLPKQWQASLSPFTVFFQRTASSHCTEQTAQLGPKLTSCYDFYCS